MSNHEEGYEDDRFEKEVDRNLHCPICMNVLKDPVQCRRNQHYFCTPCITRYLRHNSSTCPTCRDELTIETLGQPARIVTDLLSSLNIHCDYADRGCGEMVELEFLKGHVINCGYSPTLCANDGCLMIVNKQDEKHHETQVCEFRRVKCGDCSEEVQHKKYTTHGCVVKKEVDEVKMNLTELKDQLDMMRNQMQSNQEEIIKEFTCMREEMNNLTKEVTEVKDETKYIKQITERFHHLYTRADVVVAGGYDGNFQLNSVETFSWAERTWTPLESMKQKRSTPSAFVYQRRMFVAGGHNGRERLDSIEVMNIDGDDKQWVDFETKLPLKCSLLKTAVYQDHLILTGGRDDLVVSDCIYEILLAPPYSSKLLARMPQPIHAHGLELLDDKILIVGGATSAHHKDSVDSVLLYDIPNNHCKQMTPLPVAVNNMDTVSWKGNVIVLGGFDKYGKALNSVVMYDVKTGKNVFLPPMKYKRAACAAVMTGNVVVVMGGWNGEKPLDSVEYFNLDRYMWEELPPMTQHKSHTTALVKPFA